MVVIALPLLTHDMRSLENLVPSYEGRTSLEQKMSTFRPREQSPHEGGQYPLCASISGRKARTIAKLPAQYSADFESINELTNGR